MKLKRFFVGLPRLPLISSSSSATCFVLGLSFHSLPLVSSQFPHFLSYPKNSFLHLKNRNKLSQNQTTLVSPSRRNFSSSNFSTDKTHFGYQNVKISEKSGKVAEVFHDVANKYDLMNDLMSAGIDRTWKTEFVNILYPTPGGVYLDLAGGTGDISFQIFDFIKSSPYYIPETKPSKIVVSDINPSMLEVGKTRAAEKGYLKSKDPSLEWLVADAEKLPLPNDSVDAVTIAFGIRNCTHIDKVVREAYRVLKKGGRFLCMEFSHVETGPTPFLKPLYDAYSFGVIPIIGQVVTGKREHYQYLVESIRKFPTQEEFAQLMEAQGFSIVSYKNLTFGIVAIHSGFKL